jgi:UDP-N-acetyl-2-amino-2-deoxyglucuronate dehydrogenase
MIGTIVASTATRPGFATRLEVHCEKGSFTLTDDAISAWHIDDIANPTNPQFHYKHNGAVSAAVADSSAHQAIIQDFEAAIATGAEPIASGKSAALTTRLIEMVYRNKG